MLRTILGTGEITVGVRTSTDVPGTLDVCHGHTSSLGLIW